MKGIFGRLNLTIFGFILVTLLLCIGIFFDKGNSDIHVIATHWDYQEVEIKGHYYIKYKGSMVHDTECPKCKAENK